MTELLGIFDSDDGTILDATFGGVPFYMIDSRHPPGRRVQKLLFPGIDYPRFQDLGQKDGEIHFSGLLIGDDYIQQAAKLETAFQTAGPQTLIHPWLGNLRVVLMEQEISFTQDELRVARFTASVARFYPRLPPVFDTEASLLQQLQSLRQAALNLQFQVLSVVSQALSVVAYARNFVTSFAGIFTLAVSDVAGATSELIGPQVLPEIAGLSAVSILPIGDGFAAGLGALLAAPSAAAVVASQPVIPAAVAPGGVTTTLDAADARITTTMLLAVAQAVASHYIDPAPGPALTLVTQALVLADAITAASDIVFTSQQDAASWAVTLTAALNGLANQAMLQGAQSPTLAGTVWRAAVAASSALAIDMNAQIGRLPAVVTLNPPAGVSVWLLAQYLSGDTPSSVFATYLDLVQRNGIVNPCLVPAGPIEVLKSS